MSKNKKKLLIVTDFFYPHWTGIAKSFLYLVESLKKDFDIVVLTVQHDTSLARKEVLFGANIIREPYVVTISRSKYSIAIVLKSIQLISNTDVVLLNSPSSNILFFSILTKIFKKKLLIFHQGDLLLPNGFLNIFIEKIFTLCTYCSFILADKLATYTEDYIQHSSILRFFLKKSQSLLLPIVVLKRNNSADNTLIQKKKNDVFFGFAGRFVEEKGFDILFDAINEIKKSIPRAKFVFAGEIVFYENFMRKIQSKYRKVEKDIIQLGLLNQTQMGLFYDLIDFIIIPSRSDCFNLVQAEAMVFGKPSVVSDIPGARVLVKETGFGIIFETENPKSLSHAVVSAWRTRKELQEKHLRVLEYLDNKRNVRKIKEFILT